MRALIADDSKITRGLLARILTAAGFDPCDQACDGLEAWEALSRGRYDLLLTDVRMPGLDGLALLGRLRAEGSPLRDLPVVLISSLADDAAIQGALEAGALNFIRKPFEPASVRRALVEVARVQELARRARSSPALSGQLSGVGVLELVQFLGIARQSGRLEVAPVGADGGWIALVEGAVVAASAGDQRGEGAFAALAAAAEGTFRFEPGRPAAEPNITAPTSALLLGALRRSDERARARTGAA